MKTRAGAILSAIRLDRDADRSLSVQLYMGLRDLILSGGVKPGERLPASRTLGAELGISRTTVIDAVDRLVAEGLLESRVGAGTFVSDALAQHAPVAALRKPRAAPVSPPRLSATTDHALKAFARRDRLPHTPKAFVTALPALDAFPMTHWARLYARHWRRNRDMIMGYGEPFGLERLRRAIAAHLQASRGITCDPAQIFIVGGAQQAFSLIARTLLDPGDAVWFENPGAIGARNALIAQGARLVAVDVDRDGLVVADGLAKAPDMRLAFVTPSHQQPLGHVMSLARRLELLKAADAAGALIVEDDYDGDFHHGSQPQPTLKSIDTNGRVIYVGTFSKSLYPALRLGFLLAPDGLVETFRDVFTCALSGVPTAPQAIVAEFMDEGLFATHIRQMRRLYKERYEGLVHHAARLSGFLDVEPATSGFHALARLGAGVDEHALVEAARARDVVLVPLSRYCLEPIARTGVVLGYGAVADKQIAAGVDILAGLTQQAA